MEVKDFSASISYAKDEMTLYGGVLYKFTTAHSAGAWTGNDVAPVDRNNEQNLTRVIAGEENAEKAADYADTVIFEPVLISGTRYKYVLTNAPDPR